MVPVTGHFAPDGDFPAFAAAVYGEPGVAENLLRWQDEHAADVNLLLFACWYALLYGPLPESLLLRALDVSREWREHIIRPLRQCRRRMKHWHPGTDRMPRPPEYEALRQRILSSELAAEVEQEKALQSLCAPPDPAAPDRPVSAHTLAANLHDYCRHAGIDIPDCTPLVDASLRWAGSRVAAQSSC
ncbi:MAG: TIGR02444 family protein [Pseudomonadota bacterium]